MKVQYLELQEAIIESAWQNFCHDLNNEVVEYIYWEEAESIYLDEAREILTISGSNYIPEAGECWIKIRQ